MSITWRGVRSWGAGHGRSATMPLAADGMVDEGIRRCGASGWRLRDACTDGNGGAVCPLCGRSVRARPDGVVGPSVRVIEEHDS